MGIRGRLIALSIGVVVPLTLVGLIALRGLWSESRAQLDLSVEKQAQLAAVAFERWSDGQQQSLTTLAAHASGSRSRASSLGNDLQLIVGTRPYWIDLRILDAEKKPLVSHPPDAAPIADELINQIFAQVRREHAWTIVRDRLAGEERPLFLIAAPVEEGGVVVARVDSTALRDLFDNIKLTNEAVIAVFDTQNNLLYRSPTPHSSVSEFVSYMPIFNALNERHTAVVEAVSPYDGVRRVYGLAHAGATDAVVLVGVPSDILHAPARRQFTRYALLSALALLSSFIATLLIARGIVRPVRRLSAAARSFGAGDLKTRVAVDGAGGEVKELALTFNAMAEQSEEREWRLAELDRLKSEFVGSVSHELRTPLTTIKTLTRLLLRGGQREEERREYLETIAVECDRQIDLVLNLLDLSRIEAGWSQLALSPIDAGEVIHACVTMEHHAALSHGHELRAVVADGLPPVLADRTALRRALCTLVENAIKYTPGGGSIILQAEESMTRGKVAIHVIDNGRGIAAADLPHVFEKFYRGRPTESDGVDDHAVQPEAPGVGLGLFLARTIITQMGGQVTVKSEQGRGSTFTVHLAAQRDSRVQSLTGEDQG